MGKSHLSGKGVKTIVNGDSVRLFVTGEDRKQFVVTNLNASGGGNLYVGGPDQVPALVALPQLPITLETDSEFWLVNTSGFTITYVVGELFNIGFSQGGGSISPGGSGGSGGGSTSGGNQTGRGTGGVFVP